MYHEEFEKVVEDQLQICREVLTKKASEYATVDRLHNFYVSAILQDANARQALGGMMAKHTVSVYDMIFSDAEFSMDLWTEKITDHINYLILLKAIVSQEQDILDFAKAATTKFTDNVSPMEGELGS